MIDDGGETASDRAKGNDARERERVNEFGVALDRRRDRRSYPLCGATAEDDTWTSVDWREKLHFSRMKEHQQIDSIFVFLYIPAKQTFFC